MEHIEMLNYCNGSQNNKKKKREEKVNKILISLQRGNPQLFQEESRITDFVIW